MQLIQTAVTKQPEYNTDNLVGLFAAFFFFFPADALPEVIGLGITLITTLLINE